ncbi:MAG: hypothetical protein NTW15_22195 [Burkholderiales bacterium]|nr:hypothetical protein [Burkholderiales bacterium]
MHAPSRAAVLALYPDADFASDWDISEVAYGRPSAQGVLTGPSSATVRFADDAVHNATLVGPACLLWSNGTWWTR